MPHALLRGMEHTASIERPFLTSTSPLTLRRALACVNTATWLLLVQTACYAVRAKVGFGSSFSAVVISVGILMAVVGIYHGLRCSRQGSRLRGGNCAAVNMVALLFWSMQVFVSQIPLFS